MTTIHRVNMSDQILHQIHQLMKKSKNYVDADKMIIGDEDSQDQSAMMTEEHDATNRLIQIEHKLRRHMGRAITDFNMINDGDRIMVAISGGKDSWALLDLLWIMRRRAPIKFELIAVNIDQGYAGFRQDVVEEYVQKNYIESGNGKNPIEYHMEYFDIATIIEEKSANDTPCSLCSRLRRGSLYGLAEKYNCNKIALGHHLDDFIETFLLNTLFIGRTASMAPKLNSDDGKNVVIRPLVYVNEKEIVEYVRLKEMPIVCCQCPLMCGEVVHGDFKRRMVKDMIKVLEKGIPHVRNSLLASLTNIQPSHMLDKDLWKFE
jgi:tRNA 2-thiocytidine biosynthesis protein TtcA